MKTVVIAEAGVNHNGELEKALELISCAAIAGADYIKFQTFITAENITKNAPKAQYQVDTTGNKENQYDMVAKLELTAAEFKRLKQACDQQGIGFLSTAFDLPSADLLETFAMDYIKIPSGDLTNLPLLRHQAQFKRKLLISTGMASMAEIRQSLCELYNYGIHKSHITLLHCTTQYPAPMVDINLRAMQTLKQSFDVDVGYSDHSLGIEIPIAAVALGATVIEKHFTLNNQLPGPDHRASLEPDALTHMISAIRNIERALGDGVKQPAQSELANKDIARKSLVAKTYIASNEPFTALNLSVKRPGTGLCPMLWDEVIGQKAKRDFAADELIEL